jgi:D-glycero-D-manno-heptose 1,7-bisphosphate phosphatase
MKAAFLDRDGTINVDHGWTSKIDQWEWAPKAIEGLRAFQNAGYALMVVTNQSGIDMGYYTQEDVETLHQWMMDEAAKEGIRFTAIAYCPHAKENPCGCRKPDVGMARDLEKGLGAEIDYAESWMVGDKPGDVQFGKNLGMRTALIQSRYWGDGELECIPDVIVANLFDAAMWADGVVDNFYDASTSIQ